MRHKDFATTRKFFGAKRAAQAAPTEIYQKLLAADKADEPNRGLGELGKLSSELR